MPSPTAWASLMGRLAIAHSRPVCSTRHCHTTAWQLLYIALQHNRRDIPMLYHLYETQRALVEPFADFAQASAKFCSNPLLPFSNTWLSHRMTAGFDLFYRLGKSYEKPVFGIDMVKVHGSDVTVRERVELDKPFCELRRFKRFSDDPQTIATIRNDPAVLIVAPLSGHYATLLRDTVRSMLADHKVFITDWKNARQVPLSDGDFHLDDYVAYVQDFIRYIQQQHGHCHVVSVCQPTVPVLAAVSLMSSRGETPPLTMTMMGGPIDARRSPTAVNALAIQRSFEWFENNVIYRVPSSYPGAGRRVYPGFLQYAGFVAMNPGRHAHSHYDYFKDLLKGDDASAEHHRQFYDEYNAVLDLDAHFYLETIRTVFQDFNLVHGTWDVRSPEGVLERVRPQDITAAALLTVEGELDDISGSGQTHAAHDLCTAIPSSRADRMDVPGAGHYGIFSGRRWRELVYPRIRDFIQQHHEPGQPSVNHGHDLHASHSGQTVVSAVDEDTPLHHHPSEAANAQQELPTTTVQEMPPVAHAPAASRGRNSATGSRGNGRRR